MKACGDCSVDPIGKALDMKHLASAKAACLTVSGMGCQNCATRVRNSLLRIDGVHMVEIAVREGLAVVAFDQQKVQPVDLIRAVAAAGDNDRHRHWARINEIMPASDALAI